MLILVVAYGSEDHLSACLLTLGNRWPVLVIDNGQSRQARQLCHLAGAEYLSPDTNIGFAAAVNMGLRRRAPHTDVLLVNPDAQIGGAEVETLRQGLLDGDRIAAIGPRLVNTDGSPQKALWPMPSPWRPLAGVIGGADRLARRYFVSGAVLLLRSEALDEVGAFDERFFLYAEEADWQMRALRKGWGVVVDHQVTATHASGGASSDQPYRELLFDASQETFVRKWYGAFGWQIFRAASILAALRRLILVKDASTRETNRRALEHYRRGPIRSLHERYEYK